jgi:Xaa-Pro aminopeptidase
LKQSVKSGLLLFLGNEESSMNYAANVYPFRQDSSFLYYWGLDEPGLAAVIDLDSGEEILFGDDLEVEDVVWMGVQKSMADKADLVGVKRSMRVGELQSIIGRALTQRRPVHYIPQYRPENKLRMEALLGITANSVNHFTSLTFIQAVIKQRSYKSPEEIAEIEKALEVLYNLHVFAMRNMKPGLYEREIAGEIMARAFGQGMPLSFPIIFSVRGETLHNPYHHNLMQAGQLAVNDCGVESPLHYASDITRTIPVSGKFTSQQRDIYQTVLEGQVAAIAAIKPGIKYRDIHLLTAKVMAGKLKEIGLMKGDTDEAVAQGAHALFFPHGLGHMMGLDVHDMENLGENYVGYDEEAQRSSQFGLAYLRMARKLEPGFVLTVEPGVYFIPALIDQWKAAGRFNDFINYSGLDGYLEFGGVRIEDDVLVTESGNRVLGKPIPKSIDEVEKLTGSDIRK